MSWTYSPGTSELTPLQADFTTCELVYRPRNLRLHKLHGYAPVEQIVPGNISLLLLSLDARQAEHEYRKRS